MRTRVLLLIPHLGGGGAEQVTALWARALSPERFELHLGLATGADVPGYALPAWVAVHALGARRVRGAAARLVRLVRRLRPDVVLSGMAHLNFLTLALRPLFPRGTQVVVRQNSTVSAALHSGALPGYTRLAYRLLYRRADRVICQTRAMAADLAAVTGVRPERIAVIPNPVDVEAMQGAALARQNLWPGDGPNLLAVGRLAPEKGFDLLLRAVAQVRIRFPALRVTIAGAGPDEAALKALCAQLGIDPAVHFAGYVDCPAAYFPGATAFALSSRHEGLPNALLEAAAAGLPIVALPSSAGVVELLDHQPGVWLANEISAEALAHILQSALEVLTANQRFDYGFLEPFRLPNSVDALEQLLACVVRERRP